MSSLREKIKGMVSEDENVEEFDNLVLDEAVIEKLTVEDKEFIQEFKNLEMLSFNLTKISSLENFPTLPSLKRVELADNFLKGSELPHLCGNVNLGTLKLANNKIATIKDLECFAKLTNLKNLDLMGNPVCESDDKYTEKVFELIPSLEVLDGYNKEGDEVDSEDESGYGEELGEEGEEEIEEQLMNQLTEEQKTEMKEKGLSVTEYYNTMQPDHFELGEDDDVYGEEGEEEDDYGDEDGEEGDEPKVGEKRQRDDDDNSEGGAEKRKKEE